MLRVPFSFLLKLISNHPYTFTSPLQQTLKRNTMSRTNNTVLKHVETLGIQMTFERVIA